MLWYGTSTRAECTREKRSIRLPLPELNSNIDYCDIWLRANRVLGENVKVSPNELGVFVALSENFLSHPSMMILSLRYLIEYLLPGLCIHVSVLYNHNLMYLSSVIKWVSILAFLSSWTLLYYLKHSNLFHYIQSYCDHQSNVAGGEERGAPKPVSLPPFGGEGSAKSDPPFQKRR